MAALTDKSIMEKGKWAGYELQNIPASYFLWFKENVAPTVHNQNMHDYINDNLQVLKQETKK